MGHIIGEFFHNNGGPELGSVLEVQCFPLLSYIKALNVTSVDYFSLDVEGAEFDILQSIPWKEVDIKVSKYRNMFLLNVTFEKVVFISLV